MLTGLVLAVVLGADPTVTLGSGPKMCAALTPAVLSESGPPAPAGLAGVDESVFTQSPGNKGLTIAALVVRHRRLVFVMTVPASPKAHTQLLALAPLVLARVKH